MDESAGSLLFAFLLTAAAGLATGIGSAIAFFARRTNLKFLAATLGFSAGVMIYLSLTHLLPESQEALSKLLGERAGTWAALAGFFGGVVLTGLIDHMVPTFENPHTLHPDERLLAAAGPGTGAGPAAAAAAGAVSKAGLLRIGVFSAAAVSLHNLPEGLAVFVAGLHGAATGIPIAVAICLHNIPEGISVSVPIYYATGDRKKAFWYSFLTGFCEPVGALAGYLLLGRYLADGFGVVMAVAAGIMIYISFDELIPASHESGQHHQAVWGLIAGMAVIAVFGRIAG